MQQPDRSHLHFAAVVWGCSIQTTNQRSDRMDSAARFIQVRTGITFSFSSFHGIFPEERFESSILNPGSGRHPKVLTTLMAPIGTHKIGNQIVNVFNIYQTCPFNYKDNGSNSDRLKTGSPK